jgi:hypothetical protein
MICRQHSTRPLPESAEQSKMPDFSPSGAAAMIKDRAVKTKFTSRPVRPYGQSLEREIQIR